MLSTMDVILHSSNSFHLQSPAVHIVMCSACVWLPQNITSTIFLLKHTESTLAAHNWMTFEWARVDVAALSVRIYYRTTGCPAKWIAVYFVWKLAQLTRIFWHWLGWNLNAVRVGEWCDQNLLSTYEEMILVLASKQLICTQIRRICAEILSQHAWCVRYAFNDASTYEVPSAKGCNCVCTCTQPAAQQQLYIHFKGCMSNDFLCIVIRPVNFPHRHRLFHPTSSSARPPR